ncbi:hypothetical protein ACGFZU_41065 [Streptomyces tendae]|uniref:hypothetical protein n=1 Tax=Streptomyces tendae TaxID=1932 RepID=UPI00372451BD
MVADNLLVALPPTVLFAAAAATHNDLPTEALMTGVGKAAAVGLLALYVFECVNQIHGGVCVVNGGTRSVFFSGVRR